MNKLEPLIKFIEWNISDMKSTLSNDELASHERMHQDDRDVLVNEINTLQDGLDELNVLTYNGDKKRQFMI